MTGWAERALERRRSVALGALLAALAAAPGLFRLESDNSPRAYVSPGSPEVERQAELVARFGSEGALRLLVEGEKLFRRAGLGELARIEREASRLPGVESVSSFLDHHGVDPSALSDDELAAFVAALAVDPLDRAMGWIAAGGMAGSLWIEYDETSRDAAAKLGRSLDELAESAGAGLRVARVGGGLLEEALDASTREIWRRHLPLLVLFATALLFATFRDFGGVFVPLAFVGFCEVVVLGAMGWAGVRFHLVLALLPPLLFAIALATAVHLLIRCRALEAEGLAAGEATRATYAEKGRALLWTSLATVTGFGALATSAVAPVATLGRWAAAALLVQLVASFTLYPVLLAATAGRRARLPERALEERLERFGRRLAEAAAEQRLVVLIGYLVAATIGVAGIHRLGVESNVLTYLRDSHPVRLAYERAEALGIGVSTIELELLAGAPQVRLDEPEALAALSELALRLRVVPGVLAVVAATDLLDDLAAASPWAALSTRAELRAQALAIAAGDPAGERALSRFLTPDGRASRVTLFVATAGYDSIDPIAVRAESEARSLFPAVDVAATGELRVVLGFHRALMATLGRSLALTLPILFATFALLLRNGRDAAKALVPNVWPVIVLLGTMGWFGLPLDLATVMVASIVLGLAVDDTIHTLAHFRTESSQLGAREAVCGRIGRTAPAYLLTGAILIAGFGVCSLSEFVPIARFGALSAYAIALAVVSDLLLVPALFGGGAARE